MTYHHVLMDAQQQQQQPTQNSHMVAQNVTWFHRTNSNSSSSSNSNSSSHDTHRHPSHHSSSSSTTTSHNSIDIVDPRQDDYGPALTITSVLSPQTCQDIIQACEMAMAKIIPKDAIHHHNATRQDGRSKDRHALHATTAAATSGIAHSNRQAQVGSLQNETHCIDY